MSVYEIVEKVTGASNDEQTGLWAYGEAAAQRAEGANTCENGETGCPGPVSSPEWDDEAQCPDCYEESWQIDWEDTDD